MYLKTLQFLFVLVSLCRAVGSSENPGGKEASNNVVSMIYPSPGVNRVN